MIYGILITIVAVAVLFCWVARSANRIQAAEELVDAAHKRISDLDKRLPRNTSK